MQKQKQKSWGFHLIVDAAGCNDNILFESGLRGFLNDLLPAIEMISYGDPIIKHFAEHLPEAAGYSVVQLIETSAITGHFSDKNRDAYLDIFSCKEFDKDKALEIIQQHFKPTSMNVLFLDREAKKPARMPFINQATGTNQMPGDCNGCAACCHSDAYVLREKGLADWFEMHGYKYPMECEEPAHILVKKLDQDSVKIIFFDACENYIQNDNGSGSCAIYHSRPDNCRNYSSEPWQCAMLPQCSFNKGQSK